MFYLLIFQVIIIMRRKGLVNFHLQNIMLFFVLLRKYRQHLNFIDLSNKIVTKSF